MKPTYLTLIALMSLGAGSDYPQPNSPELKQQLLSLESRLQAPAGYAQLIDQPKLLGGHFVNAEDAFYYAGDKLTFEKFLDTYSKLTNVVAHTVIKRHGTSSAGPPWNRTQFAQFDWALYSHPYGYLEHPTHHSSKEKFVLWIELRLGGQISEQDGYGLRVPEGVQVIYVSN